MSGNEGRLSLCDTPVDPVALADYWLALLPAADELSVENHLFECDGCGERLREIIQLSEALSQLSRSGALRVIVGEAFIRHAAAAGQRVRQYDFAPGESVACTIAADDDLLVARLAADLSGVERVDLSFFDPDGNERQRMVDIPIRADMARVIFHESAVMGKKSPTTSMVARMVAVGQDGSERLLGEYTFHHTRTIPGPPEWEW